MMFTNVGVIQICNDVFLYFLILAAQIKRANKTDGKVIKKCVKS